MFFGGLNGFNAFYPADVGDNPYVPLVVLTAFRKFNQVVAFETPLTEVREITLSYRDNFFAFEFAALDYTDPQKNRYAYKLEGFDRDWVECGARRYASYTNLPPGTYTFRVRGANNDGVWNEDGLAVQVVIIPPFWATWWFRGLVAAIVCAVGGLIYRARARNIAALREREERFRALFENAPLGGFEVDLSPSPPRIRRANEAAARIYGRTAEELAAMLLSALVSPEAEADLERLLDGLRAGETVTLESTHRRRDGSPFPARVSAALQRAVRRGPTAIVIVEDTTMEQAWRSEEEAIAEERRRIAREIHDGLAQDLAAVRMRARLWHKMVDEAPQQQNQIAAVLRLPDDARLPAFMEAVLFRIVQEALHNVAKHAQATTVWITLRVEAGTVHPSIRDDGVGFDPAILEQAERRGHVGLKQMRERVAGLKGTFALHTAPGQGTEIRIVLPLVTTYPPASRETG